MLRDLDIYKPIIAAVNGPCVAGGMELLNGTDIRLACPEAIFGMLEPKRGIFASGGTSARLPRQIPWAAAMEFLLTAEPVPATRAMEMGLLNEIVPRARLLDRAQAWAARICENAPLAVAATKESALRGLAAESLGDAMEIEARISAAVFARWMYSSICGSTGLPSASMSATWPPTIPLMVPAATATSAIDTRS